MAISKVLVVDDSPADLKNISNIVSEAGFSVVSATNGKDAVPVSYTHLDVYKRQVQE